MSTRVFAFALVAMLVVACAGRSAAPQPQDDAEASAGSPSGDGAESPLPPGVAYVSGGVNCCEKGIGEQCCVGDHRCAKYGGFGECTSAGFAISGKTVCAICCEGLSPIVRSRLVDGACDSHNAPDDNVICAACGDGICSAQHGENRCNCPKDCP